MRYFFILLTLFLFLGCSKDHDSSDTNDQVGAFSDNPLFYQQWSINPNDSFYTQYGIDQDAHIHAQDAMLSYNGTGIKIAIIDDGFDASHPEISEQILTTVYVTSGTTTTSNVSHTYSDDMHGTAVAGIIGARNNSIGLKGIASNAQLILIKMPFDTYTDAIGVKAFEVAEYWGADIISCSWGTGDVAPTLEAKIIDVATNGRNGKGTIILFASGNDDADIGTDEAGIKEVVAVGATSKENLRTSYSNYGAKLDIVAPGGESLGITTIDPLGSDGASIDEYNRFDELRGGNYVSFVGTSAATPIAAGAIALLLQKNPSITRQEVFDLLASKSDKIGLNVPYVDDIVTTYSDGAIISGSFASSGMSEFKVRILQEPSETLIGDYAIASVGLERWEATITDSLTQGEYRALVISDTNASFVYASDTFSVDNSVTPSSDATRQKNNFYGFGKINVANLME